MKFTLPKLPFDRSALKGFLSAETIDFHYGKHHRKYVENINHLLGSIPYEVKDFNDLLLNANDDKLRNNVEQAWNHLFYWLCLTPSPSRLTTAFKQRLCADFKSFDEFKNEFLLSAKSVFGSGWVWLVENKEKQLQLLITQNAGNPITAGYVPLLVCDVWEHAYYVDFRNDRAAYVQKFLEHVNWGFVEKNATRNSFLELGHLFETN